MTRSEQLFSAAQALIPGGVNSPVRAFQAVGGVPRFIQGAQGAHMIDVDGNRYIDYVGSWGPMILGHAHPAIVKAVQDAAVNGFSFGAATEAELTLAQRICAMVPSVEMVRMTNSGTEAVMSAVRLARGFTGREKVIKFEGCYHGHSDGMLVKAGSGVLTAGIAGSMGVTKGIAGDTLVAQFNDITSVATAFEQNPGNVAAVILELVPANMGLVLPAQGFLQQLSALCKKQGALLIADEVITGFRLGLAGAQGLFGITPDLTAFGKIIGGGLPVGAFGGRADIMGNVAPAGGVYQAGTLSGNPLAMAAGNAQLALLAQTQHLYRDIDAQAHTLVQGLREAAQAQGVPVTINRIGSLFTLFFTGEPVEGYSAAVISDTAAYAQYFHSMLAQGVYLPPSQFEACFLSLAHTDVEIRQTLDAASNAFAVLKQQCSR